MKRLMLWTVVLVLVSVNAAAQPFPGAVQVGEGWVPCSHPIAEAAGQGCVTAVASLPACETVSGVTVCDLSECVGMDIYKEGAKVLACIQWVEARRAPEPPPVYTFRVGATYAGMYPSFRMKVLSLTSDSQGREVVTCEWLSGNAGVFAMVNAPSAGDQRIHPAFWHLVKE